MQAMLCGILKTKTAEIGWFTEHDNGGITKFIQRV